MLTLHWIGKNKVINYHQTVPYRVLERRYSYDETGRHTEEDNGKIPLACHAIRPIYDALPFTKTKVVVRLVPSGAILTRTLAASRNPDYPYRQSIDAD